MVRGTSKILITDQPRTNVGRARWKQGLGDVRGPMLWNVWAPEQGPGRSLLTALPELMASCLHKGCQLSQARWFPAHSQSGLADCGSQAVARSYRGVSQESGHRAPYPKRTLTLGWLQASSAEPSGKQGVSADWQWVTETREGQLLRVGKSPKTTFLTNCPKLAM